MQQPATKNPATGCSGPEKGPADRPSDAIQTAWVALNRVAPILEEKVGAVLSKAGFPDLSWYSVLWRLELAGEPTRPRDLGLLLFLPRYKLSRLVDRMEAEGLVTRQACPDDARGHLLDLTPKGRDLRKAMWGVYGPAMSDVMGGLDDASALKLADLLNRIA
jgi:DNA-binding MarR family transcriptional regulator